MVLPRKGRVGDWVGGGVDERALLLYSVYTLILLKMCITRMYACIPCVIKKQLSEKHKKNRADHCVRTWKNIARKITMLSEKKQFPKNMYGL